MAPDAIVGMEDSAHGRNPKLAGDEEGPPMSKEALANETDEERWARMDSDAHMSVYLVHEGDLPLRSDLVPYTRAAGDLDCKSDL